MEIFDYLNTCETEMETNLQQHVGYKIEMDFLRNIAGWVLSNLVLAQLKGITFMIKMKNNNSRKSSRDTSKTSLYYPIVLEILDIASRIKERGCIRLSV